MKLGVAVNLKGIEGLLSGGATRAVAAALRKAGATALRDMKSEASKRIRARKALKVSVVNKAITFSKPKGGAAALIAGEWAMRLTGKPIPLIAYPHRVTTQRVVGADGKAKKRKVLRVEVNRGQRNLVPGAFVARMKSGHEGIFRRKGKSRLPIQELFGSRPVDALLHQGEAEAVRDRGQRSFSATFERLLPLELAKGGK